MYGQNGSRDAIFNNVNVYNTQNAFQNYNTGIIFHDITVYSSSNGFYQSTNTGEHKYYGYFRTFDNTIPLGNSDGNDEILSPGTDSFLGRSNGTLYQDVDTMGCQRTSRIYGMPYAEKCDNN